MHASQWRPLQPQFLTLNGVALSSGSWEQGDRLASTEDRLLPLLLRLAPGRMFKQTRVSYGCLLPSLQCLCSTSVTLFLSSQTPFSKQRPSPPHSLGLFTSPLAWVHSFRMHQAPESCQLCLQPLGATGVSWTLKRKTRITPSSTVQPWHLQKVICQHQLKNRKWTSLYWFELSGRTLASGFDFWGCTRSTRRVVMAKGWRAEPSNRWWLRPPRPQGECLLPCQCFSLRHWSAVLTGGSDCLPPVADLQAQLCLHAHLSLVSWELHLKRWCKIASYTETQLIRKHHDCTHVA